MLQRVVLPALVGICAACFLSGCGNLPGTGQAQAAVCQALEPISTAEIQATTTQVQSALGQIDRGLNCSR